MANEYYIINPNIDKEKRVNQIFEFIKDKQFYCAVAYAKVCKLREDEWNRVNNTKSLFNGVSKNGTIKISNLFGEYKKLIPKGWNIIYE